MGTVGEQVRVAGTTCRRDLPCSPATRQPTARAAAAGAWVVAALLPLLVPHGVLGQTIDAKLWAVNEFRSVEDIVRVGNTIYIGGTFTEVGPCTGQGVPVSPTTGAPANSYPRVGGEVDAVVADGRGGWFVGGGFGSIANGRHRFLAHVLADGTLAVWNPEPNAPVKALCLSGDTLYVGGSFTACGGVGRGHGAAFDVRTGQLTAWNPRAAGVINAIASDGAVIYIGGAYSALDTVQRANLAATDRATGLATGWNPGADSVVLNHFA